MKRTAILCTLTLWSLSFVALAGIDSQQRFSEISPIESSSIMGKDTGWCFDDGACSAFASQCLTSCSAQGDNCSVYRELAYAESCNTTLGNQYCDPSSTSQVQVICATEWTCTCLPDAPPVGGGPQTYSCVGGNNGGGPGSPTAGTITTDALNCSYTEDV